MKNKEFVQKLAGLSLILACALVSRTQAAPILTPGIWTNITPAALVGQSRPYTLEIDPTNPDVLYLPLPFMAAVKGLWKSTDRGSTWVQLGNQSTPRTTDNLGDHIGFLDSPFRVEVDPGNPQRIFATSLTPGGSSTTGFWISTDGGATWTMPKSFKDACVIVNAPTDNSGLAIDPTDFNHVLVSFHYYWNNGDSGFLESKDGGNSWIIRYPGPGMGGASKCIAFLFCPEQGIGDKNTWLAGADMGAYFKTTDAGATWKQVTNGINANHGGNTYLYYDKKGRVYCGAEGYLMRSTDNGTSWSALSNSGLGYGYYCSAGGDGTNLFAATSGGGGWYTSPETDGTTWTPYNPLGTGVQTFSFGPYLWRFDPVNRIMYSANEDGGLWALRVVDSGAIRITTTQLTTAVIGTPYTETLDVIYGKAPFTWSIISGALPAGLSLSTSGIISGTTTAARGSYSFAVKVTDADNKTASANLQISIDSPRNPENPTGTTPGLSYQYFEGTWSNLPNFAALTPVKSGACSTFTLSVRNVDVNFAIRFAGYIDVPTTGAYTFFTNSDDGSRLFIGTDTVVNNDGIHGPTEKSGMLLVKAGKHAITVDFFQSGGGSDLVVSWQPAGAAKAAIAASALFSGGVTGMRRSSSSLASKTTPALLSITTNGMMVSAATGESWSLELFSLDGTKIANYTGNGTKDVLFADSRILSRSVIARLRAANGTVVERVVYR